MARPRGFDTEFVLERATDAFWERGYENLPVQALCAAMGLNPGSLYAAYGDKRQLFLAALNHYMTTVSRAAVERIHREPSGLDGITRYFDGLIDAVVDGKRRWGCLVTNSAIEFAARDPQIAGIVKSHFENLELAFGAALERSRNAGEFIEDIQAGTAAGLVCLVQGLNVLAKTRQDRASLENIVAAGMRMLPQRRAADVR